MGTIPAPIAAEHAFPPVDDALLLRSLLDVDGAGAQTWAWLLERTGGVDGLLAENPRLERHLPALAAASAAWDPPPDRQTADRLAERLAGIEPTPAVAPSLRGRSPEEVLVSLLAAVFDDRTPAAHRDRQWVLDAVLLLRAHPDLDADEVQRQAETARLPIAATSLLVHLRDVFGAPVDERLEPRGRRQAGRGDHGDRHETAALRAWARDDGADLRDVPRRTMRTQARSAWAGRGALLDELRGRAGDAVLYLGEGHRREAWRTYTSLRAFEAGRPSRRPIPAEQCRHLVVQNVADERLLTWEGPKVLFSLEPDDTPADRTAELRSHPDVAPHVVAFDDPDPSRRTPYPALPRRRGPWVERLRAELRRPRRRLVVAVVAFRGELDVGFDQEELRQDWLRSFGHDVELHGTNVTSPGWRMLPTYRGPVADKQHCLHDATFNLCFENSDRLGYVTEKPMEAIFAGAIPLYRGGGGWIDQQLPEGCLLDCRGREPGEVLEQIRSMPEHERIERRAIGVEWLASSAADHNTWQGLAAVLAARLRAQAPS